MSHTVTVDIKMKNKDAIARTAQAMGAELLGEGNHQLFDGSTHNGYAFKLPKWNYPIIVGADGVAHYDNYNGAWGSSSDLEKLQDGYAVEVVKVECDRLGWYHELNTTTGELVVHHPAGGTITVERGGKLDAAGFSGLTCEEATLPLEQAMGLRTGEMVKPERNQVQLNQQQLEN